MLLFSDVVSGKWCAFCGVGCCTLFVCSFISANSVCVICRDVWQTCAWTVIVRPVNYKPPRCILLILVDLMWWLSDTKLSARVIMLASIWQVQKQIMSVYH